MIPRLARRYASALYASAQEADILDVFLSDLQSLKSMMVRSRDLALFFHSPVISPEKKKAAIEALFDGILSAFTVKVLIYLADKGRENKLEVIVEAIMGLHREALGVELGRVETTVSLDTEMRQRIERVLSHTRKKTVQCSYSQTPQIIGGIVIRVGDTVYDGSVSRQLELIRRQLVEGTTS